MFYLAAIRKSALRQRRVIDMHNPVLPISCRCTRKRCGLSLYNDAMTNYYVMRASSDPDVIGVNNGITQADIHRAGFQDPARYADIMRYLGSNEFYDHRNAIPAMHFDLQCVRMLKKARLTDFLQFGPALMNCPFLISARAREVLQPFSQIGVALWPATVVDSSGAHAYYLVYHESMPEEMIDFPRSTYYLGSMILPKERHVFTTRAEKNSFQKSHRLLKQEHIQLNEAFPAETDWFRLWSTMVVSERLKAAIEAAGLLGVQFLPAYGEKRGWETVAR